MTNSRTVPRSLFDSSKEIVIATNNALPSYNGHQLQYVRPGNEKIAFSSSDITGKVSWNSGHTKATFTHGLNCIPIVTVLDEDNELVFPTVAVIDGTSFTIDFKTEMSIEAASPWTCVVTYGVITANSQSPCRKA